VAVYDRHVLLFCKEKKYMKKYVRTPLVREIFVPETYDVRTEVNSLIDGGDILSPWDKRNPPIPESSLFAPGEAYVLQLFPVSESVETSQVREELHGEGFLAGLEGLVLFFRHARDMLVLKNWHVASFFGACDKTPYLSCYGGEHVLEETPCSAAFWTPAFHILLFSRSR
jgi:hypothetical protein